MRFQSPLVSARLLRRYKRFLADVELDDTGERVTAHCPNPGAMLGLAEPGARIWLAPATGRGRRLDWSWKLVELPGGHLAGIDTTLPNRIVGEALRAGQVAVAAGYGCIRPETTLAPGTRTDFLLQEPGRPDLWIEVKNVHLRRDGSWAEFPDCVTARGRKHLAALAEVAAGGGRAVMLYVVQRTDCTAFRIAGDLDPAYARAFDAARTSGVDMRAYATRIDRDGVGLAGEIPVDPGPQAGIGAL